MMYEYIKGKVVEILPTYCILENSGIGYLINISLNTYSKLSKDKETIIYIHQILRDDCNEFYGFSSKEERKLFRMLLSVSGVGANTSRVIVSSVSTQELKSAIINNKVETLKSIKGIGEKTAKRIILDLKEKIEKIETDGNDIPLVIKNTIKDEASSALVILGYAKHTAEKILNKIVQENSNIKVEDLIKSALKRL